MQRPQLYWFGKSPDAQQVALVKEHKLELRIHANDRTPDFRHARAAIFWGTEGHFAPAAVYLRDHVKSALNDGIYVACVVSAAEDDECLNNVSSLLKGVDPSNARESYYRVLSAPVDLHQLLHQILAHAPGAARNTDLDITGEVHISQEGRFLLQRAFHDCISLSLEPIAPGFSGAETFIVNATLKDSFAGPEPRPFFAKLGGSAELQTEMQAFRIFAEHHVPWYLRPNFVAEKTTFGVEYGILVGTFVQNSCSLAEAVRKPNGSRHIKSLFEETLAGLREQKRTTESASEHKAIVSALKVFCKREKVPPQRWKNAADKFGGNLIDADALWWRLLDLPKREWRRSAIHGDLHGDNVRVRKEDAIVIDFARASIGPASADLAHLEVSLVFDTSGGDEQAEDWQEMIAGLYESEAISASMTPEAPVLGSTWVHKAVAEIRALVPASVVNADEYKRVLAVYLLRQASYPASTQFVEQDEYRRTFAYWLACRLTESLFAEASYILEM
jgi:thiamine kinase-like enzyme